jgi:UDP-3-O-[3-hydroxymyristoyl] glucosamine N-acyltransferase
MKLSDIARKIDCRMCSDSDMEILRVAGIDEAAPGDLTFVSNRKYISHIKSTRASAIILGEDLPDVAMPSLRAPNPYLAFARALELFHQPVLPELGVHPSAVIAPGASIGPRVSIGAYVVVGNGCRIGAGVTLHPHVVLYPEVIVGDDTLLHAHVVVREFCVIGSRVTIQNGVVIGSDGFGFAPQEDGSYYKICQTGRVIIEDDVEIGANTTVDRAAVGDTIVRRGAKLDNLVQIGHGAQVGENSVVAAQVGLAGGQAGLAGHLEVGDGAVITAQSGTSHDIPPGAVLSGSPAMNNSVWLRTMVALPRLPAILHRLRELEKEMARLRQEKTAPE